MAKKKTPARTKRSSLRRRPPYRVVDIDEPEDRWRPPVSMDDIERRYGSKADKVPRAVMYIDIGYLTGCIVALETRLEQNRKRIAELEYQVANR